MNNVAHAHTVQTLGDELESLVDTHTLSTVCEALAFMCSEKADHVRTHWQDEPLAHNWEDMASRLLSCNYQAAQRGL